MLKNLISEETQEKLLVADAKLGNDIKAKFELDCVADTKVQELMRCIRTQMNSLIEGLPEKELSAMALGLAHSLSRYKLKFSPDKVDTMIVQAISLLDDLDKELNNYIMRCREWYGWHFPEIGKIVTDSVAYVKTVKHMGRRENAAEMDFSSILPEELEQEVKDAAEISMGTEISDEDIQNIIFLCDQVLEISEYRSQLYDYLKNRMMAIAPNLTVLVGELVGARLIAHAGSLLNLAKHPSSTVQILGAEKALFRALKTKHDTPKYGLIYHASLVGQTNPKNKGKVSRMLAAKASLAIRVDALAEDANSELGIEHRARLETQLKNLEENSKRRVSGFGKSKAKFDKYENKSEVKTYNPADDSTLPGVPKKRKFDEEASSGASPSVKKVKVEEVKEEESEESSSSPPPKKKKKKKNKGGDGDTTMDTTLDTTQEGSPPTSEKKKKKKKKVKTEETEEAADTTLDSTMDTSQAEESGQKKKKKKKKKVKEESD